MFSRLFQQKYQTTEKFSFAHQGRILNVTIRRRSNAKRLTMRVRDGALALTTPTDISQNDVRAFIQKHYSWVEEQLRIDDDIINQLDAPYKDSAHMHNRAHPAIWYHGVLTPVHLYRDPAHQGRSKISHHDGAIHITLPAHGAAAHSHLRPDALLEAWLKKEAKAAIKKSLDAVLPMINEAPVPLSIRDQKTRWGSCSTTRRLSFNWRLIMAPPASLHYVVVHEAAHLIHHDHSDRFWGLVAEMMPDFSPHQQWLKTHQQALFAGIDRRLAGLRPMAQ